MMNILFLGNIDILVILKCLLKKIILSVLIIFCDLVCLFLFFIEFTYFIFKIYRIFFCILDILAFLIILYNIVVF